MVETSGRESGRSISWQGDAIVWADPNRLRQIVRNLITNAIRYGGDEISVWVTSDTAGANIDIKDSGGPIPASRVTTMFEPFVHADSGGRTPNSVGLGLAVARSLARIMGGELDYRHDGGSVFRLALPVPD
jgi:two-component system sensor histidine kinase MtrB